MQLHHCGKLLHDSLIPGETRAEDVYPGHPNGIQVARDRFLLLYATRGFRGTDDDRSVVGQLRHGGYDGPVIREILFSRSLTNWQPFEDGRNYVKQCGQPMAFGVPKGAIVQGRPAPNANVFVVKWRQSCREIDPQTGLMTHFHKTEAKLASATQAVEWMQFRLNDVEDDIEIIQPAQLLRQKGFGCGYAFCAADVRHMNQAIVQAVPYSDDGMQWIEIAHVDGGIMPLRHQFDLVKGLYQWVETGPVTRGPISEGGVLAYRGRWVVFARQTHASRDGVGIAWTAVDDPFAAPLNFIIPDLPRSTAPVTAYTCADGAVRMITSDAHACNGGDKRDPLHLFDIDVDHGFAAGNRRVIFDSIADKAPIRQSSIPSIDMGKILPHSGGSTQYLVHRVRPTATLDPARVGHVVNHAEKDASAIYAGKLIYDAEYPGCWQFGDPC